MESVSRELRPAIEWIAPRTRDEADEAILGLSNDIGLILAQLAEDQAAWCARTGRSGMDYAAWRRRALFAKVHKEAQLRECKRIRAHLSSGLENGSHRTVSRTDALMLRCRAAVLAWLDTGGLSSSALLDQALAALAEELDEIDSAVQEVNLPGTRTG
jgi:hypothetical protein